MARPGISQSRTFDTLLELHDGAAAVTSDGEGQVNSSAKIVDLYQGANIGSAGVGAEFLGDLLTDVSAFDQTTGDELLTLILEGCNTADFSSGDIVQLAMFQLGDEDTMHGNCNLDILTGRFIVPFTNEKNGVTYRYVRLAFDVAGTTPSITCTTRMAKRG